MELRHLRYFVAVAEVLNFRQAAESLHVAQPALSKQIRDLEEELGARLLDRNTARVRLTDAGAVLLDEAREILRSAQALSSAVREAAEGRRGRLILGNVGAISAAFLPPKLTTFRKQFPDVDVSLREMRSGEQLQALEAGQIQVALMSSPQPPDPHRFDHQPLHTSRFKLFLANDHPLAKRTSLELAELLKERFLASVPSRSATEHVDVIRNLFVTRDLTVPSIKAVDGLESLLALIAAGHGISLLPGSISVQRSVGLVSRPLNDRGSDLAFNVVAAWRKHDASEAVKNFVRLL
jgi:DNA-binding transcriptional LysR family regulator